MAGGIDPRRESDVGIGQDGKRRPTGDDEQRDDDDRMNMSLFVATQNPQFITTTRRRQRPTFSRRPL